MGKRGPKPKGLVKLEWSSNFAYAIGLIVSDGNLSPNGRHIVFVSKDLELAELFQRALGISTHVGKKSNGYTRRKIYNVVQFSDTLFYQFLLEIGLMPNKSKIIGRILIPDEFFLDYLRGTFDGDGSTHSYFDPRWKSSFMFYTIFASASSKYISWLQDEIYKHKTIKGHVTGKSKKCLQLKYAKSESLILLKAMYYNDSVLSLSRKRLKVKEMLRIIGQRL
jgi:LAGLIDADG-like domain